ncbi:MAG: bifunctional folylpolyglutamate synthase/dihydrofolate synthase [Candidatus Bathyarchaeota archaeon]|nr:bifunctional folylpolyglutamate synthase/dihydrofolate synthase [Candidatus Bathyarchaeota archaeon]
MATSGYKDAVDWLFQVRRFGPERTLDPIRRLAGMLGDPQNSFKAIHITGTNGKGSTSAMIASILRAAGYSVGLYTSPHLERFTERIVVDGEEIPEEDAVRLTKLIHPLVESLDSEPEKVRPLFFDIVTAMAFKYFEERHIDFAVLEVGMGGRLDATNIVQPLVSVITNISLEHTQVLGDTVLKIAYEKAGIIKPDSILVTATQDDSVYALFEETCARLNTEIHRVGDDITFKKLGGDLDGQSFTVDGLRGSYTLYTPLLGGYQLYNAATAVGAVEALSRYNIDVSGSAISDGLASVEWPGRLEVVQRSPLVVLDSAKDAEATRALAEATGELPHRRLIVVVSISSDKNISEMIANLASVADAFVVTSHSVMGRAAEREGLGREIEKHGKPWEAVEKVGDAVKRAMEEAGKHDMILVTGSVFAVGEARRRWKGGST